jgi:hypothetical protein
MARMANSSLRGRLDVVPLLELLGAIARARKSGTASFHSAQQSMHVTVEHGAVRAVSTDDPSLRIGQVLIQLGLVTEEQIEQALALQSIATDPERVGEVLVDFGYISEKDISHAMAVQMRTVLNVMLDDSNRYFEFHPDEPGGPAYPQANVTRDPLVQTATDLFEGWLARFTELDDLIEITHPARPRDPGALDELEDDEHTLVTRLLDMHRRVDVLIALRNRHAVRVKRSVEWLLKHVLMQIDQRRAARHCPQKIVQLVDHSNDVWALANLTRTARHTLLHILNGEQQLKALLEGARDQTEDPDRVIHELVSAGLITLEPAQSEYAHQSPGAGANQKATHSMAERLMP